MPKRPSRSSRCAFAQGGRRCQFAGCGDPPLCDAHRLAAQVAARPQSATTALASAIENLLQGKPINVEQTIGAVESAFRQWAMGGSVSGGPFPGRMSQDDLDRAIHDDGTSRRPPPQHPPPRDPTAAARAAAITRAKSVLGLRGKYLRDITAEEIKDRRKRLARKHHPDVGGSAEKMALINQSADLLLEAIGAN